MQHLDLVLDTPTVLTCYLDKISLQSYLKQLQKHPKSSQFLPSEDYQF